MTDPASPAAVTDAIERVREFAKAGRVPGYFKLPYDLIDLLSEFDARGLELARRDEEVARLNTLCTGLHSRIVNELDPALIHYRGLADAAEARLAQANEALTMCLEVLEPVLDINKGTQANLSGEQAEACFAMTLKLAGAIVKTQAALKVGRFAETETVSPTPPAQSAGEALGPAGTGEDLSVLRRRLTAAVHRGEPLVSVSQDELARLLAQASALAGAPLKAHTLHVTGQEFLAAIEHVLDWMNGNDTVADYSDQRPAEFQRQCDAMEAFRDALNKDYALRDPRDV